MNLNVLTTYNCNLHCQHCLFQCPAPQELDSDDFQQAIALLKPFGLKRITFTGGEPLMHTSFEKMVSIAVNAVLDYRIVSNAFEYQVYFPIIQKYRPNFLGFNFSLDGREEMHDTIRGKGSFSQVVEAVRFYTLIGVPITINHVLNLMNYDSFEEFLSFCKENGFIHLKLGGILDNGVNQSLLITTAQRVKLYRSIPELTKRYAIRIDVANSLFNESKLDFCPTITQTNLTLNPLGEFLFCCDIPGSSGRLGHVTEGARLIFENKNRLAERIRLDRIDSILSGSLTDEEQYCVYCFHFTGENVVS